MNSGPMSGVLDCRHERRDERPHVEFIWEADDDSDPAHGRRWRTTGRCAAVATSTWATIPASGRSGRHAMVVSLLPEWAAGVDSTTECIAGSPTALYSSTMVSAQFAHCQA
jgi:hypothetical protein